MITQASNLNLIPERSAPVIVHVSQFDTGSRTLSFRLFNGPTIFSIPSGASVKIQGIKKDGNAFEYPMTVSGSTVSVLLDEQMTVIEGEVKCQIVITQGNNVLGTANFILLVEPSPINDGTISESNIPAIITLVNGGEVGQFLSWGENGAEWSDNGSGDMNKATYDTNDNGIVDNAENARNAEKVNGKTVARDVLANEYTNSQIDTALSAKANASDVNTALALKQDTLTFDATPTANSNNPVYSKGIKTALDAQKYFYIDSEGYGCINYDLFQTA